MKNMISIIATLLLSYYTHAQNVGVGTTNPQAKLEVKSPGNTAVKISSNYYLDTSRLILSNRSVLDEGTDMNISFNRENGLKFYTTSDLAGLVNDSILYLRTNGSIGVGTNAPTEKLDIRGNLNVAGNIKLNGVAGASGQVLQTLSSGATAWVDAGSYTNVRTWSQSGAFTIPTGITRIRIEAWGAGGGGASGGGGAAGLYIMSMQDVTPGDVLTITVGIGGANATTNPGAGQNGTNTSVTGLSTTINALGGSAANEVNPGNAVYTGLTGPLYATFMGQSGDGNTEIFGQKNTSTFIKYTKYGDGGAAAPDYNRRAQGEHVGYDENSGTLLYILDQASNVAPAPGGGGAGGRLGTDGARGTVRIWY